MAVISEAFLNLATTDTVDTLFVQNPITGENILVTLTGAGTGAQLTALGVGSLTDTHATSFAVMTRGTTGAIAVNPQTLQKLEFAVSSTAVTDLVALGAKTLTAE